VDYLFRSIEAAVESGLKTHLIAGILTGMGSDGAQGLLALKKRGVVTFAQDEASSVVYGMPRAAKEIGAADSICSLAQVPQFLIQKSTRQKVA
jgi:two-component system chemotaxis response regulator CheB